ncbi:hypothetical protein M3936_03550 [Sutcliffiella horikoshii]|uniref:hypothetical protein n=1 Tax=Sutcliffiella horikoshii TaxID=79883 RepID=UPI00203E2EAB|nr:hypothetical protein [Sutcliffiella horikoshii]MCM3616651.1 hypothetical protein [Sutcliffiella horikoshii]
MINVKIDNQVFKGLLVDENHLIFLMSDVLMFVEVKPVKGEKGLYEYVGKYTTLDEDVEVDDVERYLVEKRQELFEVRFVDYLRKYCSHDQDFNFAFRYKGN